MAQDVAPLAACHRGTAHRAEQIAKGFASEELATPRSSCAPRSQACAPELHRRWASCVPSCDQAATWARRLGKMARDRWPHPASLGAAPDTTPDSRRGWSFRHSSAAARCRVTRLPSVDRSTVPRRAMSSTLLNPSRPQPLAAVARAPGRSTPGCPMTTSSSIDRAVRAGQRGRRMIVHGDEVPRAGHAIRALVKL